MALLLTNAILHIINNNGSGTCFSNVELEVESETCYEFVTKHVRRLINAPAAGEATFRAESAVYRLVKSYQRGEMFFKDFSLHLADRLNGIMQQNPEIPPGDLLICAFDNAKQRYIAVVKLPYTECYTHRIVERDGSAETQLIKNPTVLPATGNAVSEACLIPYDPMILRVTEKQYPVNGEMCSYFSELFLECDTELSKKETSQLIQEIVTEVNHQYYGGNFDVESKIKQALVETAPEEEEEGLNLETAAKQAFGANQEAVDYFVNRTQDAGLPHEVKLSRAFVQRELKMQRIKADNGIEVKFPLELLQNPEAIQIETNHDGSLTVTLKNLRNAER